MLFVLPLLSCFAVTATRANWEYNSEYVGGGWYSDNGSRFVLSVRAGASYGRGKIKNDIGELSAVYYYHPSSLDVISEVNLEIACTGDTFPCNGYEKLGYGNIGNLAAAQEYKKLTFAAGASVGWVLPNATNWRLELGWDKITEADYNATPLFEGDLTLVSSIYTDPVVNVQSGAVHSTVSTDVISAMAFYDFFEGNEKPTHTLIPYVGLGLGYANSVTELQLYDRYGDLSSDAELIQDYSEDSSSLILKFYKSETTTSNIAGLLAVGVSYGLTDRMFMDFGARFMYIPRIKWSLSNEDNSRHRDWFSAKNIMYTNVMLGLRFEF